MKKFLGVFIFLAFASSSFASAAKETMHCAYTNDGDGGDEGYEVGIWTKGRTKSARLTVIDPSGARVYAKISVKSKTVDGKKVFSGKDFTLTLHLDQPKTDAGYTVATLEAPTEFGGSMNEEIYCQ